MAKHPRKRDIPVGRMRQYLESGPIVLARLEASDGDDAKATAEWMKKALP
jgi:hypothetical protein